MPANKTPRAANPGPRPKPSTSGRAATDAATTTSKPAAGTSAAGSSAARKAAGATPAPAAAPKRTGAGATSRGPSGRPGKSAGGRGASGGRPATGARQGTGGPGKPKSKSIVSQRRTPWGTIATGAVIVVFAAAIIVYALTRPHKVSADTAPYVRKEIAAAKAIPGVIYKAEPNHTHVFTTVKYNTSPPTGGNHSQIWADCTGTVYAHQIANENAVHPLEHGAVWITYRPGLDAKSIATLAKLVTGQQWTFMTPYAGLKTAISLQSWDYQLFVKSATDPRIVKFIKALRHNPGTTPEYGASCSNPSFKKTPSTPGHPIFQ